MLNQCEIITFFNGHAHSWNRSDKRKSLRIQRILDFADIHEGCEVLDVACGTGVLFPEYCDRKVAKIVGVDISKNMIEQAKLLHLDSRITLRNEDIHTLKADYQYERIMVFNALPHFPSAHELASCLATHCRAGARLTIAHDIGRERLNEIHRTKAPGVSKDLMEASDLAAELSPWFDADTIISENDIYVVSALRKNV